MDCRGRVTDRVVVAAWVGAGDRTRLQVRHTGGLVVVAADPGGAFAVTGQGHVRVPATVRHWYGLQAGDRVLLAAGTTRGQLVIYPPAAVDTMTAALDAAVLDDGAPA
jgi:hypothetical protein